MKKILFFAATAMLFAACTNDELVSQSEKKVVANEAVGFDVYIPGATASRAGLVGTMTTGRLQRSEEDGGGFGVYAFLTEDTDADPGTDDATAEATAYTSVDMSALTPEAQAPNFMVNEKILWNASNQGWYYNPLKYWPNETDNDSQSSAATMEGPDSPTTDESHLDRLTFFAYAPYVSAGSSPGITAISDNTGKLNSNVVADPTIAWEATTDPDEYDPNEGVDLLWGVAPAGGLSYTAVNGWTVTRDEGTPLLNMIKPDVNTSMKFLFQHALARFGINIVAAIDQVSPGGKLDPNTKITVDNLTITGPFGTEGELNLNNGVHAGIANWTKIQDDPISSSTKKITTLQSITVTANGTTNAIAENLCYYGDHTAGAYSPQPVVGVTTAKQDLLIPSNKWFNAKKGTSTPYNPAKKYFTDATGSTEARAEYDKTEAIEKDGKWGFVYTKSSEVYTKLAANAKAPVFPSETSTWYFVKVLKEYTVTTDNTAPTGIPSGSKIYQIDNAANDGTTKAKAPTFTENDSYSGGTWAGATAGDKVYTLEATLLPISEIPFKYTDATIYEAERNYLYVVPTNNVAKNTGLSPDEEEDLRTITVKIEYYITTKDAKLTGTGFAQTKNVITKTVVLPSLANGKTYMLNLVLGLTSVKVEAEVDDWKVVNVQADLPQNTAE